ncbi:MAG: DNA mismatch repair protein [Halobacteriota archaeon]|uniref:DNA mismatch repair protein n=1 Tax=Natronomonas sp. TaxID=2184060 RepID=UPI003975795D
MELEEYWGIGPKTREVLEASIGTEVAIEAIESGDVRALVEAGVDRSRVTRVLRHAHSAEGMALLATGDARVVYKELLETIAAHAVSEAAADRLRTLTPLTERDEMDARLDAVERGRDGWKLLGDDSRTAVFDAFERYDESPDGRLAAVEAAVDLARLDASAAVFEPIDRLDTDALAEAAVALGALGDDRIASGADDELDRLRDVRETVDRRAANTDAVLDELRSGGVDDTAAFREGLVELLGGQTTIDPSRVRSAMARDAVDAAGFVSETLRALRSDLDGSIDRRSDEVRAELESAIETAGEDVDRARPAVTRVARELSLGRFAAAYDLERPTYIDGDGLAVVGARNLSILDGGGEVQPITYAVGDHGVDAPAGERVTVLTGANSGGKTTLLETLCEVAILAHMGLPVAAETAEISTLDRLVFHRRHASFNAGVLESTLQSVVPPLVSGDRTLMLVDEFEAITEPGRAADLLGGLVRLTITEGAIGTFVTHLANDLEPLPETARIDGIFAKGLTDDLELEVDYQPRFGAVGRSTPEFIVSRLVANADDRAEEAGFRTLAKAVNTEVVQRTLSDAEWTALASDQ